MKEEQRKGTIYFRGAEELATYDKLKAQASSLGISFSEHVKNILKDPLWFLKKPKLFVKTLSEFFSGDYDFQDSLAKALGEIPTREQVRRIAEELPVEQLLLGFRMHEEQEKLSRIIKEEFKEAYKRKMKELHGVDVYV